MNSFYFLFSSVYFLGVILSSNPIYSLLNLMAMFFVYSYLFVSLGLELIGFLTVFMYIGAISILFLFVIMFLEIPFLETGKQKNIGFYLKLPYLGFLVFFSGYFYLGLKMDTLETDKFAVLYKLGDSLVSDNLTQMGNVLYNQYGLGVLLSAIILLVAMMAAISICTVLK